MLHHKINKKADLSLQTIIVAAILIIVLIVIIAIFSGRIGNFNKAVDDCASKGSKEMPVSGNDPCKNPGDIKVPLRNSDKYCCIPVLDRIA